MNVTMIPLNIVHKNTGTFLVAATMDAYSSVQLQTLLRRDGTLSLRRNAAPMAALLAVLEVHDGGLRMTVSKGLLRILLADLRGR